MRIKRYAPPRLSRRVKIETLQTAGFPAVLYSESAGMMELVDMRDLGSRASGVGVRVPMPAPRRSKVNFAPTYSFSKRTSTAKPTQALRLFFACSAAPPKNKKCASPERSGLTHFCYTIFPSNFLPFFHLSPDSMKKAHGGSATGFTQNRHTLWAYYSGFTEKFQMVLFTNFTCRTPLNT